MWTEDIKWPSSDYGDFEQHVSNEGIYGWESNGETYLKTIDYSCRGHNSSVCLQHKDILDHAWDCDQNKQLNQCAWPSRLFSLAFWTLLLRRHVTALHQWKWPRRILGKLTQEHLIFSPDVLITEGPHMCTHSWIFLGFFYRLQSSNCFFTRQFVAAAGRCSCQSCQGRVWWKGAWPGKAPRSCS